MALATISETLSLPASGSAATLRGTRVRLRLVAADSGEAVAYSASVTTVSEAWQKVANDGSYSFTGVRPNTGSSGDQITDPAETVYELSIVYPSGTVTKRYLDVPDSTGPHAPADIEVNNPNTIRRWRSTDLYDFDASAADADGEVPVWNNTDSEFVPGTVPTAGITDAAVTTAKLNDDAVTTAKITDANVTTAKLAAEAVTSAKVDHTVELHTQGSRARQGLGAWEAALANAASAPVKMVCLRDSHGELGVDKPFFQRVRARMPVYQAEPNALSGAARWVPAETVFGLISGLDGSHSGAVSSTAGPAGYAAEIDTGDYVQFGGWAFTLTTGWRVYGVGDFDISVNGGSATPTTLAAGEAFDTGALDMSANTVRLTATSDGSVVWGAYAYLDDNSAGFQNWVLAHSGWEGNQMVSNAQTWDLVADIDPDLVLCGFATNQDSEAEYRTDLENLISSVQTAAPNASIVVWFPWLASASGDDEDWWAAAELVAKDVARENGAVLVNLYPAMGDVSGAADVHGLSDDDTHTNTKGTAVASQLLAQVLLADDNPRQYVDGSGNIPAYRLRLREIVAGSGDVKLLGGNAATGEQALNVTNAAETTRVPVFGGDPPDETSSSDQCLLNRSSADARYQTGIWLGGQDLYPVTGSPSVLPGLGGSVSNNRLSAIWGLADSTTEGLGANLIIPSHWSTFALTLVVVHGSGSGNVAYRARYALVTLGATVNTSIAGDLVTVANGTQYNSGIVSLLSGVSCTPGQILDFRVQREGADAADTFSGDHGVMGVIVSRAS